MTIHSTKIIPHNRPSSDFNPGTRQLFEHLQAEMCVIVHRARGHGHGNPHIAPSSPTPRLTPTLSISSTPRSRLAAWILPATFTAQNNAKKKVCVCVREIIKKKQKPETGLGSADPEAR